MSNLTPAQEALRALAKKATPGEWEAVGECIYIGRAVLGRTCCGLDDLGEIEEGEANAAFIAHANPAVVLALLDELAVTVVEMSEQATTHHELIKRCVAAESELVVARGALAEVQAMLNEVRMNRETLPVLVAFWFSRLNDALARAHLADGGQEKQP